MKNENAKRLYAIVESRTREIEFHLMSMNRVKDYIASGLIFEADNNDRMISMMLECEGNLKCHINDMRIWLNVMEKELTDIGKIGMK